MFNFLLLFLFKNFSHFKSIDVTPFITKLWCILCAACGTVWCRLWGVSVQQVVLWWVCVGIVWLCVEGIKCGVSVQQVALVCGGELNVV